jgi:hypothetical protein
VAFTLAPRAEPYKLEFRTDEQRDPDTYALSVDIKSSGGVGF